MNAVRYPEAKFLNSKGSKKKKCTVSEILHTDPKKNVEHEYEVYFYEIRDNKISPNFFEEKSSFLFFVAWRWESN